MAGHVGKEKISTLFEMCLHLQGRNFKVGLSLLSVAVVGRSCREKGWAGDPREGFARSPHRSRPTYSYLPRPMGTTLAETNTDNILLFLCGHSVSPSWRRRALLPAGGDSHGRRVFDHLR